MLRRGLGLGLLLGRYRILGLRRGFVRRPKGFLRPSLFDFSCGFQRWGGLKLPLQRRRQGLLLLWDVVWLLAESL